MNRFTVSTEIPASPRTIYDAWLDDDGHGEMTGSPAAASTEVGGGFTAHGSYIWGVNLELVEGERILQTWRTSQFADSDPDSSIEVTFETSPNGTIVTLKHWNIPEGQAEGYRSGWQDHYFDPMQEYFSKRNEK